MANAILHLQVAIDSREYTIAYIIRKASGVLYWSEPGGYLCHTASKGDYGRLRNLLQYGINPESRDSDGRTPMNLASKYGYTQCVQALMELGARTDCVDNLGRNPLDDAVQGGWGLCAHLLRVSGSASLKSLKQSLVCASASSGLLNRLQLLLDNGCDVNSRDVDGRTPCQLAAAHGNLLIVSEAMSRGADLNSKDRWGLTPLSSASRNSYGNIARILASSGSSPSSLDAEQVRKFLKDAPTIEGARAELGIVQRLSKTVKDGYCLYDGEQAARCVYEVNVQVSGLLKEVRLAADTTSALLGRLVAPIDGDGTSENETIKSIYAIAITLSRLTAGSDRYARASSANNVEADKAGDVEMRARELNSVFARLGREDVQTTLSGLGSALDAADSQYAMILSAMEWLGVSNPEAYASRIEDEIPHVALHEILISRSFEAACDEARAESVKAGTTALKDAFDKCDTNYDGFVSSDELKNMSEPLTALGMNELLSLLYAEADASPDARGINFSRFNRIFLQEFVETEDDTYENHHQSRMSNMWRRSSAGTSDQDHTQHPTISGSELPVVRREEHEQEGEYRNCGRFATFINMFRPAYLRELWYRKAISLAMSTLDKNGNGLVNHADILELVRRAAGGELSNKAREELRNHFPDGQQVSVPTFIETCTELALEATKKTALKYADSSALGVVVQPDRIKNAALNRTVLRPNVSRLVLSPGSSYVMVWHGFSYWALNIWYFFDVPFRIAFQTLQRAPIGYLAATACFDILLWIDILAVRPFLAFYTDSGILVTQLHQIRMHYLSTNAPLDVISAFPLDWIVLAASAANGSDPPYNVMAWVRILRLLRMKRLFDDRRESSAMQSTRNKSVWNRIVAMMPTALAGTHIFSCIFFWAGTVESQYGLEPWFSTYRGFGHAPGELQDLGSIMEQYVFSLHWITSTFSSHGITEARGKNYTELALTIFLFFVSFLYISFVVGVISDAIQSTNARLVNSRNQSLRVEEFISRAKLPESLAVELRQRITTSANDDSDIDATEILRGLSHSLQVEVARAINRQTIEAVPILTNTSEQFKSALSVELEEVVAQPSEQLFTAGSTADALLIVSTGRIEMVEHHTVSGGQTKEIVSEEVSRGEALGEVAFLFKQRHAQDARIPAGSSAATLFKLSRNSFELLRRFYEQDVETMESNAIARFEQESEDTTGRPSTAQGSTAQGSTTAKSSGFNKEHKNVLQSVKRTRAIDKTSQLLTAVAENNSAEVETLLVEGEVDADGTCDTCKQSPLQVASREGYLPIVQSLVEKWGATLDYLDPEHRQSALATAMVHGHDAIVDYLAEKGATVRMDLPELQMIQAAEHNDTEKLNRMLRAGVSINLRNYDKRTALHIACTVGSEDSVRLVCDLDEAELSPEDDEQNTPLLMAIEGGFSTIQEVLRTAGGSLGTKDLSNNLNNLANNNQTSRLSTLRDNGANMNACDHSRRTPLAIAASNNCIEVSSFLCSLPEIEINAIDGNGCTPLDEARHCGNRVIESLLQEKDALEASSGRMREEYERNAEGVAAEKAKRHASVIMNVASSATEVTTANQVIDDRLALEKNAELLTQAFDAFCHTLSRIMTAYRFAESMYDEDDFESAIEDRGHELQQQAQTLQAKLHLLEESLKNLERRKPCRVRTFAMYGPNVDRMVESCREHLHEALNNIQKAMEKGKRSNWAFAIFDEAEKASLLPQQFRRRMKCGEDLLDKSLSWESISTVSASGKVAVVTLHSFENDSHSANHIGLAVAHHLAADEESTVILACPSSQRARAARIDVEQRLGASDCNALVTAQVDLMSQQSVQSFVRWLGDTYGGCDTLIHAATTTNEKNALQVNALGCIRLTQELIEVKKMMPRNNAESARVVAITGDPECDGEKKLKGRWRRERLQWLASPGEFFAFVNKVVMLSNDREEPLSEQGLPQSSVTLSKVLQAISMRMFHERFRSSEISSASSAYNQYRQEQHVRQVKRRRKKESTYIFSACAAPAGARHEQQSIKTAVLAAKAPDRFPSGAFWHNMRQQRF